MASFLALFPNAIANLIQAGFLVREMEEGLDSILAYRRLAIQELFPGRIGETMTRTRKGRRAPVTTPLNPANNSGLDNGIPNASTTTGMSTGIGGNFSIEQYTATLAEYADTIDLNIMQTEGQIADQFIANARNNGVQAAQSLERICRMKLFGAYMTGHSRLIADPGATILVASPGALAGAINNNATGTPIHLDDIRGFQQAMLSGSLQNVSANTNELACTITSSTGTTYAVTVQLATSYSVGGYQTGKGPFSITTTPDANPGYLTIKNVSGVTYTPTAGDTIDSNVAAAVLRPNNRVNMSAITAADVLSLGLIEDGVAYLRDNAVPPMDDGTFHLILDNTSMRQLYADQDFKILFAGRSQSPEALKAEIVRLLGVTFVPTTEAYVQLPFSGTGPKLRRPILAGAEAIIQTNYEGMQTWLSERGLDRDDSPVAMVDGVVQIVREPLDRLKQIVAQTWTWIGDYAVPSDITATNTVIPTASNALYKRCVVIEHAG
jgi:hypothetical protein